MSERLAGVFVNDAGTASWRRVELGLRSRELVEVLEGLEPEDMVIMPIAKQQELTDGARITTK